MSIQYADELSDVTPEQLRAFVDDYYRVFKEWVTERGGAKYLNKTKGEWAESKIKKQIERNIKKYPNTFDQEYKDFGYPVAIRYALHEIGEDGKDEASKFVRKNAGVKKQKKGSWLKRAAKSVSKAAKGVAKQAVKSATGAVNAIAKSPILDAVAAASPAGPIIAAAKVGKAARMVARAHTPKVKAYKKKLQAKIKAQAAKIGAKTTNIEAITAEVNKAKAQGKPVPMELEVAVAENAAISMAEQSANTTEVSSEIDALESRIRERAAKIGIAQANEPINVIVDKAKAQLNVELNDALYGADYDVIGEEGGDESGKLKEDVTEYVLLKQAQGESGGGNTMLYVGIGAAVLGAAYFMTKGK